MKKVCLLASFFAILIAGVSAQEVVRLFSTPLPGGTDTEAIEGYYRTHPQLPTEVRQLLDEDKVKEALVEYEKIRKSAKADPLDLYLWDLEVYSTASFKDPSNPAYGKMCEDVRGKMKKEYSDNAEVIYYTLPENSDMETMLEMVSKAIKVDPDFLPLYEMRFRIYLVQGKKDEACQDYAKLPEAARVGLLEPGMDCNKELEAAKK